MNKNGCLQIRKSKKMRVCCVAVFFYNRGYKRIVLASKKVYYKAKK